MTIENSVMTLTNKEEINHWLDSDKMINDLFPKRSIKRILLITPPDVAGTEFNYDLAKRGRYTNFPPYGLGVLVSNLRMRNISVRILNLHNIILKECQLSESEYFFDYDGVYTKL